MISEFLTSPQRFGVVEPPEMDALIEDSALEEAALFDIRVNAVDASAWLLLDCKGALEVRAGNTAIVVIKSLQHLEWTCPSPAPHSWCTVWAWKPSIAEGLLTVEFVLDGGGEFRATGSAAEFFVGDVPGGDDPPPNFTSATDEEIRKGLAQWSSPFTPLRASFLDLTAG